MKFPLERDLVEAFRAALDSGEAPWYGLEHATEFDFRRGRTDVLATSPRDYAVYAFEAKLTRWRYALQQAYRSTSFAHRSYVVLPKQTAMVASRCAQLFKQLTVGLCYVDESAVVLLIEAMEKDPLQQWLTSRARDHIRAHARTRSACR